MTLLAQRYELGELLGEGGFAAVYAARDVSAAAPQRELAIKLISRAHTTPELAERFRNEALALSRMSSPHIARVFDFGRDDERGLYLVMERIRGVPLDVAGLGRALNEREILLAAYSLFSALAAAHAQGIVHRDVKPANVLAPGGIDGLGELKVLDFGIALAERRSEILAAVGSAETMEGHVVGTPAYMAPEQITLGAVGPAADVYAAGLVLFELLGQGPVFVGSPGQQIAARLSGEAELEGRAPPALLAILKRALARDPDARFRDGTEALLALPADASDPFKTTAPNADVRVQRSIPAAPSSRKMMVVADHRPTAKRLPRLDADPARALRDALFALDLPFLDALARRERDNDWGLVARATSLTLRLELAEAARILEPAIAREPTARAVAATLIATRADLSIVERLGDLSRWIDDCDPELGCLLATAAVALGGLEHANVGIGNCAALEARADGTHAAEVARWTARMAFGILGREPLEKTIAFANVSEIELQPESPLEELARASIHGILAVRADEHTARLKLEQAIDIAASSGAALFEARALLSWGAVMLSAKPAEGLVWLERATTLLRGGGATSLDQMAQHNIGAALMIQRRYSEAIEHLERAIELARHDGRDEYSMLATATLAFARATQDDLAAFAATMTTLDAIPRAETSARARAFSAVARTILALRGGDEAAALAHVTEARELADAAGQGGTDAWLMAEVLAIVVRVARGESHDVLARAAELEHLARERGFASFFWFDAMLEAIKRVPDPRSRERLLAPMQQFIMLLGPAKG